MENFLDKIINPNLDLEKIREEFLKNKVTDTVNQLSKSDRKRKFEINANLLNESLNEDMDTIDPKVHIGSGWYIYKK